jgi:hypothetical protein
MFVRWVAIRCQVAAIPEPVEEKKETPKVETKLFDTSDSWDTNGISCNLTIS